MTMASTSSLERHITSSKMQSLILVNRLIISDTMLMVRSDSSLSLHPSTMGIDFSITIDPMPSRISQAYMCDLISTFISK